LSCTTESQTDKITGADDCYTHATTVGVSNDIEKTCCTSWLHLARWHNIRFNFKFSD